MVMVLVWPWDETKIFKDNFENQYLEKNRSSLSQNTVYTNKLFYCKLHLNIKKCYLTALIWVTNQLHQQSLCKEIVKDFLIKLIQRGPKIKIKNR